jgi:lipopolysaccharide export system permease protein
MPSFGGPLVIVAAILATVLVWRLIALLSILDRQRYWSFFKAYTICYVSLVGLYVVIDAFSNLDEFTKRADTLLELFQIMSRYYLIHQSEYFDQLCGVIGMMAAIFTVTWMQRNNEQLAMLAAGISTHRAIFPVLVSSVIVSVISAVNQEVIIPYFGEELARRHDDDGEQKVNVSSRYDSGGTMIHGRQADRATRTIMPFYATTDVPIFGRILAIDGQQATYIPPDHPTAPLKGGWLVREATINPPVDDETLLDSRGILTRVDDTESFPPPLVVTSQPNKSDPAGPPTPEVAPRGGLTPHSAIAYLASLPPLPLCLSFEIWRTQALLDRKMEIGRGTYFLRSSLTFQAMTRKAKWFHFAPTLDLLESLTDPSTDSSEAMDVKIFVHLRLLRPFLGFVLLLMSLPLVLGGYGRNMFINLGFALGNSAIFYGTLILTQYLGSFEILSPANTAWVPLMGFGVIATIRWGQIRT